MGDFGPPLSPEPKGLPDELSVPSSPAEPIHVLVTGFGPFKTNPLNPSFIIASSLPESLSLPSKPGHPPRQVRIHVHQHAIRVSYSAVRNGVPEVINAFRKANNGQPPDITIHIGMASTRHYYSVETLAHRDGYKITDVDGQVGYEDGEVRWKAEGLPPILRPGLVAPAATTLVTQEAPAPTVATALTTSKPTITVSPSPPDAMFLETWRSFLPAGTDVRISDDAGRYLCEFIFYTGLALAFHEGRCGSVIFLHVPGAVDQDSVDTGVDVTIALVKTLAARWVKEPRI